MFRRLIGRVARSLGRLFGHRDPASDEPVTANGQRPAVPGGRVPRWLAALRTRAFTGVALAGLAAFGVLTALVGAGATADQDLAASLAVQQVEHPWLAALLVAVSAIGFPPLVLYLVGGAAALLWLSGLRVEAGFTLAASGSGLLTQAIKAVVARPRPAAGLVRVVDPIAGSGFPSGHTIFYATFFGFLGYLSYALMKPGRRRTLLLWLCGALILLVGPSRIWLGHHWPSDVLASYALGLAYLIVLVQAYGRARLRPA